MIGHLPPEQMEDVGWRRAVGYDPVGVVKLLGVERAAEGHLLQDYETQ